jgi:polyhydroxyalkanoate synthesis regulator phasin
MTIRNRKKTIAAAGASLALVAAMVGGSLSTATASAWAASTAPGLEQIRQASPAPEPKPRPGRRDQGQGPRGGDMQQRQQMQEAYLNALAGRLGLSVDQLKEAQKQARIDLVNKAVADGKLTQEQANRKIQAIQNGQGPGQPGMGQRGQRPGQGQQGQGQQGPGQGQRGPGMVGPGQAIADLLGMTPQDLRTELQGGKSLAQVAEAKGVSRDTLKAKILETQKARLDAAVAAGRMTAEQAQQAAARMSANIDRMLDATPGQRQQPRTPGGGA